MRTAFILAAVLLSGVISGCASKPFYPKSDYPADPWVKGYADPDDCIGGEKLAAVNFELPDYPKKSYRTGRQGWVILRLDVDASGQTQNVRVERALPAGMFGGNAKSAAKKWLFRPPAEPLNNCRVLIRYQLGKVSLGG